MLFFLNAPADGLFCKYALRIMSIMLRVVDVLRFNPEWFLLRHKKDMDPEKENIIHKACPTKNPLFQI